jgi:acetamidase/formamidase
MPREHTIDPTVIHHHWDNRLEPALAIQPGDTVHYDLLMAGDGQVNEDGRAETTVFDWDTLYNLSGPLFVEGAEPGDTLSIEMLSLETGDWGWTSILPKLGLLPDDFPQPYLHISNLRGGGRIPFTEGISIPRAPFLGTMGTHPDDPIEAPPFPPNQGGGNIDNRHLVAGTTLLLPVWVPGALFSCGDPHAAQGDGEVCVSAIECPMRCSLRFDLIKRTIAAPSFRTPGPLATETAGRGYHATMGIAPDLMEGARIAVRAMIEWLGQEHGLERQAAYVLCSLAGDLKVHELVDAGVWNVGFAMPLEVFER